MNDDEMNDFFLRPACLPCTLFAVLIGIGILYVYRSSSIYYCSYLKE